MSFLIQRAAGRNLALAQVSASVLRIGRGTNQELRSENPAVALEHAIIESDAAGYLVTDKGSITGTYVNGKPVESARLSKGDVIEIGDLRIEVQMVDPAKPLFLRVVTTRPIATAPEFEDEAAPNAPAAAPGQRVLKARKIDYAGAYRLHRPWLTKVGVTAILAIVALAVVGEVIRPERQKFFMPGGLSSAHARARDEARGRAVADDCSACHLPWRSVSSAKCLDCHPQQPHSDNELNAPDCFACHAEHRGATKLAMIPDTTCTSCHADLSRHVKVHTASSMQRIAEFGDRHPELTYPGDADTLRFNHKLHLNAKGIFNATGKREVLQCTGCHELVTVKGKIDPIALEFERHCQRCHRLTFDARIPNAEVPHGGEPGIVYGYVGMVYSGNRDLIGKPPTEVRRILATRRANVAIDERAQINADQVLKTKCKLCHDIERRGAQLAVRAPVIRAQWLTKARFSHGAHRMVDCESCHAAARTSFATSDVLLPVRKDCTKCHARNAKTQTATPCVTCHEYHLRPQRQRATVASLAQAGMGGLGGGGRMLQGILLAIIVVLLLVVLVPVGIALFQRLRPERAAAPPRQRAAPPPPPPPPQRTPDMPTDKVRRAGVPDLAPPVVEKTRIIPPEPVSESTPSGTEMVQWYGMLHCTSGPLEGQRFIVEDEGFYIGRDPALAKVVVPDSRVSKRHLRIVPRDGKVWAIDQGSTNGTFMRDQRISEVQLKRGDTLVLGDNAATFVYQI